MSISQPITLLTDFGNQDGYVGMMKGAIAQINPSLSVIDLTHHIPPQDIAQARFVLMTAFPYFPLGTVHVAVVDPGVGGARRGIAIAVGTSLEQPDGILVGPDNGLFSGVFHQYPVLAVVELSNPAYWRTTHPSHTFHGRDIFAPVAAHLASGIPFSQIGPAIAPDTLTHLPLPPTPVLQENLILGCIQAIDHFGNLITTIPASAVANGDWSVELGAINLPSVSTYSDRSPGTPITLIGSHGWVEIAIVQGNAQAMFKLKVGDQISTVIHSNPRIDGYDG